jgi:alkylhydroperoxidase family enzyme
MRIPPLSPEQWTDAAREVFAFWGEPDAWENGSRTNSQMVLANHPPLAMAFNNFGRHVLIESTAPAWTRELMTLRIAWHLRSQYEWHYHVGYALNLGMTMEQIAAVRTGPDAGIWSEIDAAALRCVDELWGNSRVTDATWATLSAHYNTHQLMDLVFLIGQYVMLGWGLAAFGVQLEDGVDPIGFDLMTRSGIAPATRLKPGEAEGWADDQFQEPPLKDSTP